MKNSLFMVVGLFLCASVVHAQEKEGVSTNEITQTTTNEIAQTTITQKTTPQAKKKRKKFERENVSCTFTAVEEMKARSRGEIAVSVSEAEEYKRNLARWYNVSPNSVFIISAKVENGLTYETCVGGIYYKFKRNGAF
ncbi:hypothetical protein QNH98_04860 [Myroides sp. mNGS23_01]|nr:hypothetical protein [Myroides sp. mNGS23_01]WHT39992.1 hypothetical protein QNH98_04860 [Myroides sp. mNGS23_01]